MFAVIIFLPKKLCCDQKCYLDSYCRSTFNTHYTRNMTLHWQCTVIMASLHHWWAKLFFFWICSLEYFKLPELTWGVVVWCINCDLNATKNPLYVYCIYNRIIAIFWHDDTMHALCGPKVSPAGQSVLLFVTCSIGQCYWPQATKSTPRPYIRGKQRIFLYKFLCSLFWFKISFTTILPVWVSSAVMLMRSQIRSRIAWLIPNLKYSCANSFTYKFYKNVAYWQFLIQYTDYLVYGFTFWEAAMYAASQNEWMCVSVSVILEYYCGLSVITSVNSYSHNSVNKLSRFK